jgi:hypothetical protein
VAAFAAKDILFAPRRTARGTLLLDGSLGRRFTGKGAATADAELIFRTVCFTAGGAVEPPAARTAHAPYRPLDLVIRHRLQLEGSRPPGQEWVHDNCGDDEQHDDKHSDRHLLPPPPL